MSVQRRPSLRPPRTTRGDRPCVLPEVGLGDADTDELVAALLCRVGEDLTREGLRHTPDRVARSLEFLTSGYGADLADVVNGAVFAEDYSEMVLVKDIEVYSLCEHHLLPFFGKAHVAYIPDGRIIGLSKLPRLVDVFARRLQVQERLTTEIAEAVDEVLSPAGVGVIIEAVHLCMMMRGVQQQNSRTVTSSMRGVFLGDPRTRDEFLSLVHGDMRHIP
jgi:GTP cyclohydrolase IA